MKEKSLFRIGDYILMTEQSPNKKLEIGKIVEEYYGSEANSSYFSVLFGDGTIERFPMFGFENIAKKFSVM